MIPRGRIFDEMRAVIVEELASPVPLSMDPKRDRRYDSATEKALSIALRHLKPGRNVLHQLKGGNAMAKVNCPVPREVVEASGNRRKCPSCDGAPDAHLSENATVVCRARKSKSCSHGRPQGPIYGQGSTMAEDGTWNGESVICDPCYIAGGQPSIGVEATAGMDAEEARRTVVEHVDREMGL